MSTHPVTQSLPAEATFARTLIAVDGSVEALRAVRQIDRLAPVDAQITIAIAAVIAPNVAEEVLSIDPHGAAGKALRERAEAALREASAALAHHEARTQTLVGPPAPTLLLEARRSSTSLLAVGSHGIPRGTGILLGSVATVALHQAPCDVFVARGELPADGDRPLEILVGFDASPGAHQALATSLALASRLHARVQAVLALDDLEVPEETVQASFTAVAPAALTLESTAQSATDALLGRAADLIVVGSRGLGGIRALGSVSERVGHRARCSVLVVRHDGPVRQPPVH